MISPTPKTVEVSGSRSHTRETPEVSSSSRRKPVVGRNAWAMSPGKDDKKEQIPPIPPEDTQAGDALGQFSYAPATQTTVVTTTTTTTTKFPPFRLRAPLHLNDLDDKVYPLASSPTPQSIKRLQFDVEGTPTMFEEADDTLGTMEKLKHEQRLLSESQGTVRSIAQTRPEFETPMPGKQFHRRNSNSHRKRAVSPISIFDAASLAAHHGSRKRRMVSSGKPKPTVVHDASLPPKVSHSRLHLTQISTPVTPQLDSGGACLQDSSRWRSKTPQESGIDEMGSSKASSSYDALEGNGDDAQILSPRSDVHRSMASSEVSVGDRDPLNENSELPRSWQELGAGSAITSRVEANGEDEFSQFRAPPRPRPMALNTTASQDVSLPSPSLSPVTAAANMQSRREYFEQASSATTHNNSAHLNNSGSFQSLASTSQNSISTRDLGDNTQSYIQPTTLDAASVTEIGQTSAQSLMSLPSMVDTFDSLPEEMKRYLIFHILRRCSKPVLHFVADVVNPTLRCDFLSLLPVELCVNVISNLDAKTLCRAAQVSKRWRERIDTSEGVWKRLFDTDHYVLPDGELQQAICEGWGWQHVSHSSEFERDLSRNASKSLDAEMSMSSLVHCDRSLSDALTVSNSGSSTSQARRSKRKAKARPKLQNRKHKNTERELTNDEVKVNGTEHIDLASADGPYAAAKIALARIARPHIGIPSLENMHLFKSLYMRHDLIRKTWMADEVSPRHIAFRAHQRHVVTCLQFDAEKILTGSDDANINVYDTKTGALKATLEGHEGGVWALQYEGNVLVSGSTDRTVRVWNIVKGRCTQVFQGHTSTVRCLQILMPTPVGRSHDGRTVFMPKQPLIITGSRDSNLRVWRLPKPDDPDFFQAGPAPDESVECPYYVRTLTGHHHSVRAIAAHADTLVSGSYDCSVRVWKISTGEIMHRLNGHNQKVYSVVLDTKRNRCISGSMDNLVKVWSLDTGSTLFTLEGHTSLVGLLDLQQDRLVSAAADSTLRIWDPETGRCKSTLTAHTGAITCFQHDGQKVISGSDRTLKMWNVVSGGFSRDLLTGLSGVWQVKFNERRCVAAVQRNNLTYIEVLDFGASRDGIPASKRGRRIVVNSNGQEINDLHDNSADAEAVMV